MVSCNRGELLVVGTLLLVVVQLSLSAVETPRKLPFFGLLPLYKIRSLEPEADDHPNDIYYSAQPDPANIPEGFELRYPNYRFVFDVPKDPENSVYVITEAGQDLGQGHHGHHHVGKHGHVTTAAEGKTTDSSTVGTTVTGGEVSTLATSLPESASSTLATSITKTTAATSISYPSTVAPSISGHGTSPIRSSLFTSTAAEQTHSSTSAGTSPPTKEPVITTHIPVSSGNPTNNPNLFTTAYPKPLVPSRRPSPHPQFRNPFYRGPLGRPHQGFQPSPGPFVAHPRPQFRPHPSHAPFARPSVAPPPFDQSQRFRPSPLHQSPTAVPPTPPVYDQTALNRENYPAKQYRHFPGGFVRLSTFSSHSG